MINLIPGTTNPPTEEQRLIEAAALNSQDNLLISALAGAAKTSTLVMLAHVLSNKSITCLAFNKRIAVELQERLPSNCTAVTLNSLGHRAWMAALPGTRVKLDDRKVYSIVKRLVDELAGEDKEEAYSSFSTIIKGVESGKIAGYIPDSVRQTSTRLLSDEDFFASLPEEPTDLEFDLMRQASAESVQLGMKGIIDFADQLLLPTVFHAYFPRPEVLMVDESQDLSELNHAMLRKICRAGATRVIGVGDAYQSIYGFRGAHQNSMRLLQSTFSMVELNLTTTFRCPTTVVAEAQWRAPAMRAASWAKPGEVRTLVKWDAHTLIPNSAVVCRNNAPLFSLAMQLLKEGVRAEIVGRDLLKGLLKTMEKFGPPDMPQDRLLQAIANWREKTAKKSRERGSVDDRAECMEIFALQSDNLRGALAYADTILNQTGSIQLMTGHKSKGLEFPHVYILDRHLIRLDQDQDRNLLYVMQTRAKETLTYISLADMARDIPQTEEAAA